MKWWQPAKDVFLTGLAIWMIITQVYSEHPKDVLLGTALALLGWPVADHARALLSGSGGGASSTPAPGPPAPPSAPSSPAVSGDPHVPDS